MNRLFCLGFIFLMASCSPGDGMAGDVEIFYIPIGVETYVPITENNIESSAIRFGNAKESERALERIRIILETASDGEFDDEMLRAKITLPNKEVIYIDNRGGISSSVNGTSKLGEQNLNDLKSVLESVTTPIVSER
jgi:hypothetical protein